MARVQFRKPSEYRGEGETDVLVDGEKVAEIRKRSEWYGNLGHRGVRYTYYDFYRPARDGAQRERLASDTVRRLSVAQGLVVLGMDEAALEVDHDRAKFYIGKRSRA